MESWDDEDFEPPPVAPPTTVVVPNKWEGEDEDDDVKDNWEDEDEDKSEEVEEKKPAEVKKNKRKVLEEKIAEKERQNQLELEKRLKEQEEELTPEERLRMQKESDLKIALETTFGDDPNKVTEIDGLKLPTNREEFEEFADSLSKQLTPLSKSPEYTLFIENLTRNLCATMSSLDIKKIKNTIDNLFMEKQKIEKGDKSKKSKGKGKAKLKLEGDNDDWNDHLDDHLSGSRKKTLAEKLACKEEQDQRDLEEKFRKEEQKRRETMNYVIMRHLPESPSSALKEQINYDRQLVNQLVAQVMGIERIEKLMRVGKPSRDKARPIKVIMDTPESALKLLKKKEKIVHPTLKVVGPEQTPTQRKYLENLQKQLDERKQKGEKNLTIKYVAGVPKIVSL